MVIITYDTLNEPYAPSVRLRITDTFSNLQFETFTALVDSGADYTCIPRAVVDRVSGYSYDWRSSEEFTGNVVQVKRVRILEAWVEFLDTQGETVFSAKYANLRLPIVQSGLLGRDILNHHRCVLNGPGLAGELG
jgi:Retroviral aspartyl protease